MGRNSKLTDKQWNSIMEREDWHHLANSLCTISNNEKAVIQVLRLFLAFGHLHLILGIKPVERHRFEVTVATGRIDLLLSHADGGVTIIEAKAQGHAREIAPGIGQLCMYDIAIRRMMRPKYINRILAAPIEPENSVDLVLACQSAGVRFMVLPTFNEVQEAIKTHLGNLEVCHG